MQKLLSTFLLIQLMPQFHISNWVFWVFLVLALSSFFACLFTKYWRKNFNHLRGDYDQNGMRRMFVFNRQPYIAIGYLSLAFILSVAVAAIALFLVGGVGFILLWIIKILLWVIIILGYIAIVVGIIGLFLKWQHCLYLIIGGAIILFFSETLSNWGNACIEAGLHFYEALNLWEYCMYLVLTYGYTFLFIALAPIVVGLSLILLILIVSSFLILFEYIWTKHYNIKHPCPFCHNPSEPACYLSKNYELPVKLRPGFYGLFYISHPVTKQKMPTMLLNGRDNLTRKCPHCNELIYYNSGIEKHIAFVGLPESGKTCLTYRFIGYLMTVNPKISFTDEISKEAKRIIADIKDGKQQDLASKTSVNSIRRSLQLRVPGKEKIPYHFFINDVGGELYTTSGIENHFMQFFKDVQSISILLDPYTIDFSDYQIRGNFEKWYRNLLKNKTNIAGNGLISNVFDTIKSMLDQFMHSSKQIHINIVLVKVDTGYIQSELIGNELLLKEFIIHEMGLEAEVDNLEHTYASVHYYAVSAIQNLGINFLTEGILNDINVKM